MEANEFQVAEQSELVRVVSRHVQLKRRSWGPVYTGVCPFHEERTGSFSVNAKEETFHCFGCGAAGGVEDFQQRLAECAREGEVTHAS